MYRSRIVYSSDNPPARKGWDALDLEIAGAFDREVEQALASIGRPATFDEVAEQLPAGVPYAWLRTSLRAVAECRNGLWQIPVSADVVTLAHRTQPTTTRKAAA